MSRRIDARPSWIACSLIAILFVCLPAVGVLRASAQSGEANAFRVCADPNNLPFSNRDGSGFENKLAGLIAGKLGQEVTYTWWAQRRGFIRNTLKAGDCDVVMGIPSHVDMVETTRPYYRSTYVFVSRADRHLDIASIKDPRLHDLKIGVQLIGNDGFNTPPAHALSEQGMVKNIVGYMVYGDYTQPNPPARIVQAVASGDVDIAAVWGPLAGYFAKQSKVPLTVTPITDTESFKPLLFQFSIGLGVRKGNVALKNKLDAILTEKQPEIQALLQSYGIPTLPIPVRASEARVDSRK
jgi:quinoprotein dehydrogenase-associated probable ABC transporter substrate-binding protein